MHRDAKAGTVIECRGELVFYIEINTPGKLSARLERLPDAPATEIRLSCGPHPSDVTTASTAMSARAGGVELDMGTFGLHQPGMLRLTLATTDQSPLRLLKALHLSGPAIAGAKVSMVERRNASSVHLWYDVPAAQRDDVEWFYCELTPKTDPLWTYYMATGWQRGYFGMQVNSETERRVIFSVWDAGGEAKDRDKVGADDRVQLLAKGDGVHASDFGNEGTGGHSHLVHPWRLGDTFRFLVRAQVDGTHTTYTGWFWFAERGEHGEWGLIASFKAPKDGKYLQGLYSFSENFSGSNGDRLRECAYGNVWARTRGGEWLPLRTAKFTHDGHGNQHRTDRQGGVRDGRFFLRHGDFATTSMRRDTALALQGEPGQPPDSLPAAR